MKKYLIPILSAAALLITACGYKEGAVSGSQKSYIFFTGVMKSVEVSIDGAEAFEAKVGETQLYKVEPGKHSIKVMTNSRTIVERVIYVGDGTSKEIEVPNVE